MIDPDDPIFQIDWFPLLFPVTDSPPPLPPNDTAPLPE